MDFSLGFHLFRIPPLDLSFFRISYVCPPFVFFPQNVSFLLVFFLGYILSGGYLLNCRCSVGCDKVPPGPGLASKTSLFFASIFGGHFFRILRIFHVLGLLFGIISLVIFMFFRSCFRTGFFIVFSSILDGILSGRTMSQHDSTAAG